MPICEATDPNKKSAGDFPCGAGLPQPNTSAEVTIPIFVKERPASAEYQRPLVPQVSHKSPSYPGVAVSAASGTPKPPCPRGVGVKGNVNFTGAKLAAPLVLA